jgi:hypothetical protein
MGEGSAADRIVTDPANKATGYGKDAAANPAARALGENPTYPEAEVALATYMNLLAEARLDRNPPPWVQRARKLWLQLAAEQDTTLASVLIADLGWFSRTAYALTKRPGIRDLPTVFAAWTNSAILVLVAENLFVDDPDEAKRDAVAKTLLRHEAKHVVQFRQEGGPPPTYWAMCWFESVAYAETAAELAELDSDYDLSENAAFFVERYGKLYESDSAHRQAMIDRELLPATAGPTPASLYVP